MEPSSISFEKEFNELIEDTKKIDLSDSFFKDNIQALYNNFIGKKICIMCLGEASSGKTSLINCFISYDSNQNKFNPAYLNLLPRDDRENTCYLWVVESSPDENFYIKIDQNFPKKYSMSQLSDLKKEIKELNESQKKEIPNMKFNVFHFQ